MCRREIPALWKHLGPQPAGRTLSDARCTISLTDLQRFRSLSGPPGEMAGRSVLIAASTQMMAALAMIELDGVARRMLLCPPDIEPERVTSLMEAADIDAVIVDENSDRFDPDKYLVAGIRLPVEKRQADPVVEHDTEWLMLTSGTSGLPKIVRHTLGGLAGAIMAESPGRYPAATWATFYDIRRYGGLQIFLRALIGGGSMVLSTAGESPVDHVSRLRAAGVTHISGTPSHWRKLLMSGAASEFSPRYVRLSGEIADQAVLNALAKAFPQAAIGHAYASTEAGVAFSVDDGLEGFPASLVGGIRDGVEIKVLNGSLLIRSSRTARSYIGPDAQPLTGPDGFVDTGDEVELRAGRYYFLGRRGGIINIGGLKVHPEEIESAINRHEAVRMSRAHSRRNPIIGAVVVADVVLTDTPHSDCRDAVRDEIMIACRTALAAHKVPAVLTFVDSLDVTPAGKLVRADA